MKGVVLSLLLGIFALFPASIVSDATRPVQRTLQSAPTSTSEPEQTGNLNTLAAVGNTSHTTPSPVSDHAAASVPLGAIPSHVDQHENNIIVRSALRAPEALRITPQRRGRFQGRLIRDVERVYHDRPREMELRVPEKVLQKAMLRATTFDGVLATSLMLLSTALLTLGNALMSPSGHFTLPYVAMTWFLLWFLQHMFAFVYVENALQRPGNLNHAAFLAMSFQRAFFAIRSNPYVDLVQQLITQSDVSLHYFQDELDRIGGTFSFPTTPFIPNESRRLQPPATENDVDDKYDLAEMLGTRSNFEMQFESKRFVRFIESAFFTIVAALFSSIVFVKETTPFYVLSTLFAVMVVGFHLDRIAKHQSTLLSSSPCSSGDSDASPQPVNADAGLFAEAGALESYSRVYAESERERTAAAQRARRRAALAKEAERRRRARGRASHQSNYDIGGIWQAARRGFSSVKRAVAGSTGRNVDAEEEQLPLSTILEEQVEAEE